MTAKGSSTPQVKKRGEFQAYDIDSEYKATATIRIDNKVYQVVIYIDTHLIERPDVHVELTDMAKYYGKRRI